MTPCARSDCNQTFELGPQKSKRFCSDRCQRIESKRRARRVSMPERFRHPRYMGEYITDQDLGDYYKAVADDPCTYCGGEATEVDHIVPRAKGGDNFWMNRVAICRACNIRKMDKSVLMFMLARPIMEEIDRLRELMPPSCRQTQGGDPRDPYEQTAGVAISDSGRDWNP